MVRFLGITDSTAKTTQSIWIRAVKLMFFIFKKSWSLYEYGLFNHLQSLKEIKVDENKEILLFAEDFQYYYRYMLPMGEMHLLFSRMNKYFRKTSKDTKLPSFVRLDLVKFRRELYASALCQAIHFQFSERLIGLPLENIYNFFLNPSTFTNRTPATNDSIWSRRLMKNMRSKVSKNKCSVHIRPFQNGFIVEIFWKKYRFECTF